MENLELKQKIVKTSYYCQSVYTSIDLFIEFTDMRKYDVLNELLMKIIEDISECIKYYSNLNLDMSLIYEINNNLNFLLEGYSNKDYFYIRDILEYEIQKNIEAAFKNLEVKVIEINK